ncbi:hypothetical protein NIES2135_27240 [Leptolyngbya boryana NIES-2135]|jgi:hypothetical protein|uniref:Uncharacterized protein n=1 Tax=Leptolyngbya boryana NIES-2135 TaxID=1973484 RepID=A0A1Z4JGM6_LEPBY|nr:MULTISPECIES: hypothetical protein [Leptolyngbya]BAY55899.1 hypothetical protein NIES2135_27240 [Leptolyngbya boryana NIES-2135]MBD2368799.1 hypothetical protein [Leptolyngbya sp. FACHB-161]MBD2375333.1 hypothetical protein [Leptolyngbya sp. FACHB-238]MBD2399751.1 hypothetical protein [Leptolyngbya sp. FACHB-239]MBD2405957.1 hypothetical protein [Leptolyngbya sp. FACHB-402]
MMTGKTATIIRVGKPLSQSLVGQRVEIVRLLLDKFPVVRTTDGQEFTLEASNLEIHPYCPPAFRVWLEARMRHFERMIPKLAKNPNHYRLVQGLQAEYEQVLAMLGINDEEVEF